MRATIDTNLNTSPGHNLDQVLNLPDTILEFKYLLNLRITLEIFLRI